MAHKHFGSLSCSIAASMPYAIPLINFFFLSLPVRRPHKLVVEGFGLFVYHLGTSL